MIAEIKSRLPESEEALATTGTRINETKNLENISEHPAELSPGKTIAGSDLNGGEHIQISTAVTKTNHKTNRKTKSTSNDSKTNLKKPTQVDKTNGGTKQKSGNKKKPVQSKNISSFFRAKNQSNQNDHRTVAECRVKKEPAVIEIDSDSQTPEIIPTNQETNCQPLNSTILPQNTKQQPLNSTILPQNTKQQPLNSTILPQNTKQHSLNSTILPQNTKQQPLNSTILPQNTKQHSLNSTILPQNTKQQPLNSTILPQNTKKQPLSSTIFPQNTKQQPLNSTILPQKIKQPASPNTFPSSINSFRTLFCGDKFSSKQSDMLVYDSDSDQFNSSDSSESQSILQNVSSISPNRNWTQLFIFEKCRTRIEHPTVLQESDIETESDDEQITHLSGLTNEISNLVEEAIRNPPSESHFEESLIPNAPTEFSCTQIESQ